MNGEISGVIADLRAGLRLAPLWLSLGWDQTLARFRRTVLGPFWLSANLLAIALAMSYIFGSGMGTSYSTLFPTLLAGLITWSIIGGPLGEAAGVFISSGGMMQSQNMPLSFYAFLMMHKSFINFCAQLLALWTVFLLFRVGSLPSWPILIGLPIVLLNSFFISLIIAVPSTRFRDLNQLSGFIVQILFFLTPVFWAPERMSNKYRFVVDYNPFAHMLELVRQPLLGRVPATVHFEWGIGTMVVAAGVAIVTLALYRKRIIFWL